jgi:hypothetical protein
MILAENLYRNFLFTVPLSNSLKALLQLQNSIRFATSKEGCCGNLAT